MKGLGAMIRGFLATDRGEILSGGPQCVLHQHGIPPRLPRIKTFLNAPSDVPGCRDMAGSLERHRLKDDELLRVPAPVTDPPKFEGQCIDIPPPHLPTGSIVLAWWHDRKVTPPPLPQLEKLRA